MPINFLTSAQGVLDSKKNQFWLLYKHWVYVHFYGPMYIAHQRDKPILGQSPGVLLPPFSPNAMRGTGPHPGQDSQHALPGRQSAPPDHRGTQVEALVGQRRWTQAAKQSLSSRACLGKSREGNKARGKEECIHGHICVQGGSYPRCSLSCCHHSFDPLRGTETPWDPNPPSGCFAQLPPLGKGSVFPSCALYVTGWHLSCPIAHRRVQKPIPPSRRYIKAVIQKGGAGRGGEVLPEPSTFKNSEFIHTARHKLSPAFAIPHTRRRMFRKDRVK